MGGDLVRGVTPGSSSSLNRSELSRVGRCTVIDPLKPEDLYGTGNTRQRWRNSLWQGVMRCLCSIRSTVSKMIARPALLVMRNNCAAQFMQESAEYEPGFAVQDTFDLSLTWDDLKFLRSNHIQPLTAIEQGGSNKPSLCPRTSDTY